MVPQDLLTRLSRFANSAPGLALDGTIGFAEGADYDTIQGYVGRVTDWKDHPRKMGPLSDAAGKSQFLSTTWDEAKRALGLPDFSPQSQRIAMAYLADRRLKKAGLGGIEAIESQGLTPDVAAALAPEWASFPTKSGKSYYGQPVKKLEELQSRFAAELQKPGMSGAKRGGDDRPASNDMESALLRQIMGGSSDNAMGGLGLGSLKVPGLEDIGGTLPGLRLAGAAAPLVAAMSAMDPEAGRMAGAQLQQAIADQQIMQAHSGLATALMPDVPRMPGVNSGQELDAITGMGQATTQPPSPAQNPRGKAPGIRKTAYGDNVQFETPDGARYRLIHGTKDLKTGTYVQGGWGPQGANQYGDHFDIARVDGGFFDRSALDKFALVNGKPLSAGLTVKGGEFGASRDGGARVHKAWDYAFGKGARLQLANGARWLL